MNTCVLLWRYVAGVYLEGEILQANIVEKVKTHILCSIFPLPPPKTSYLDTWKNIVEPDRSQTTIWRMRIACWIAKG